MSITRFFRERSTLRIYLAVGIACSLCAIVASIAYRLSSEFVGPAAAQAETRLFGLRLSMAAPAAKPHTTATHPVVKPPIVATIISHAQPTGDTALVDAIPGADSDEWANYEPWTAGRADTYRTVCVRLCDGAYHPVSFSTTRDRFKADAAKCQASCDQPSRLFVVKPEGSPEDMVDVRGGSYTSLRNAFKFQTSYNAACSCRGQPWEAKAQERHRQLALVAHSVATSQSVSAGEATMVAISSTLAPVLAVEGVTPIVTGSIAPVPLNSRPAGENLKLAAPASGPLVSATKSVAETIVDAGAELVAVGIPSNKPSSSRRGQASAEVQKREVVAAMVKEPKKAQLAKRLTKHEDARYLVKVAGTTRLPLERDVVVATRTRRLDAAASLHPPVKTYRTATSSSSQRPFRSAEYWRLSFWETSN